MTTSTSSTTTTALAPQPAAWFAVGKADIRHIVDEIPNRAGGLALVWLALLEQANRAGSLSFELQRALLAARVHLSRRMVNYHVEDLARLGLLTYRAETRGGDGRLQPTRFTITPSADPVHPGQPIAQGDHPGQPIARTSVAQFLNNIEQENPLSPPQGGFALVSDPPARIKARRTTRRNGRVTANSETMLVIGGWFGRRSTTLWSREEAAALEALGALDPEDLDVLQRFYRADHPAEADYRRRNVVTLLNNWNAEVDKARRWDAQQHRPEGNIV